MHSKDIHDPLWASQCLYTGSDMIDVLRQEGWCPDSSSETEFYKVG